MVYSRFPSQAVPLSSVKKTYSLGSKGLAFKILTMSQASRNKHYTQSIQSGKETLHIDKKESAFPQCISANEVDDTVFPQIVKENLNFFTKKFEMVSEKLKQIH